MFNDLNLTDRLIGSDPADPNQARYDLEVRRRRNSVSVPFDRQVSADTFQMPPPTIDGGPRRPAQPIWIQMMMMPRNREGRNAHRARLAQRARQKPNGKPYVAVRRPIYLYDSDRALGGYRQSVYPLLPTSNCRSTGEARPKVYLTGPGGNADMIPANLQLPRRGDLAADQPAPRSRAGSDGSAPEPFARQWCSNGRLLGERKVGIQRPNEVPRRRQNIYCLNGPMPPPAELGYIPRPEWARSTFARRRAGMLANLVADTTSSILVGNKVIDARGRKVFYTNGTINPNTRSRPAASAFYGPGHARSAQRQQHVVSAAPITADQAYFLAQSILDETKSGKTERSGDGGVPSGHRQVLDKAMQQGGALRAGITTTSRESQIRNTWGLFIRKTLFTVVEDGCRPQ
jgi:hypothetical protein